MTDWIKKFSINPYDEIRNFPKEYLLVLIQMLKNPKNVIFEILPHLPLFLKDGFIKN